MSLNIDGGGSVKINDDITSNYSTWSSTKIASSGGGGGGGSGTGDVVGPSSSVDNSIPRYDGTTGKVIKSSGIVCDASNNLTGVNSITSGQVNGLNITKNGVATNTLVGATSTAYTTTGSNNSGYGNECLLKTSGTNNCAFGALSQKNNTTASRNISIGTSTLETLVSGTDNIAIGDLTLKVSNNSGNIAIGTEALVNCTQNNNIAIGYKSGAGITTQDNTISIGLLASATASNQIVLGNQYHTEVKSSGVFTSNVGFKIVGGLNTQYLLADGSTTTNSGGSSNTSNIYLYNSSTVILPPPGTSQIRYNNTVQSNATEIYISHLTRDGIDIDEFLTLINNLSIIYIQDQNSSLNYIKYSVSGTPTIVLNDYITIPVSVIVSAGTGTSNFINGHNIFMSIFTNTPAIDTRISAVETKTQNQSAILNETSFNGEVKTTGVVNCGGLTTTGNIIAQGYKIVGKTAQDILLADGSVNSSLLSGTTTNYVKYVYNNSTLTDFPGSYITTPVSLSSFNSNIDYVVSTNLIQGYTGYEFWRGVGTQSGTFAMDTEAYDSGGNPKTAYSFDPITGTSIGNNYGLFFKVELNKSTFLNYISYTPKLGRYIENLDIYGSNTNNNYNLISSLTGLIDVNDIPSKISFSNVSYTQLVLHVKKTNPQNFGISFSNYFIGYDGIVGDNQIRFNNSVQQNATSLYISYLTKDNINLNNFLSKLATLNVILIQDNSNNDNYINFDVVGAVTYSTNNCYIVPVVFKNGNGSGLTSFGNNQTIFTNFFTDTFKINTRISALDTKTQNQVAILNETTFSGSVISDSYKTPTGTVNQLLRANGAITTIGNYPNTTQYNMFYNPANNDITYRFNVEYWKYQFWGYYAGAVSVVDVPTGYIANLGGSIAGQSVNGVIMKGNKMRTKSNYSSVGNGFACGWLGTGVMNYLIPKSGFYIKIAFSLDATTSTATGNRTMIGLYQQTGAPALNNTVTIASLTVGSMGIIQEKGETVFSFNTRGTSGSTKIASTITCETPNDHWYMLEMYNAPFSSDITLVLTCQNATTLTTQTDSTTFTCGGINTMPITTSYVHLQQNMASAGGINNAAALSINGVVVKTPQ